MKELFPRSPDSHHFHGARGTKDVRQTECLEVDAAGQLIFHLTLQELQLLRAPTSKREREIQRKTLKNQL